MIFQIEIVPGEHETDGVGASIQSEARDLGLGSHLSVAAAYGFLLQGSLDHDQLQRAASLLSDSIVQSTTIARVGSPELNQPRRELNQIIYVLPKPGVMDPVALSTLQALQDMELPVEQVATFRKYWVSPCEQEQLDRLSQKLLSNDSIERVVFGPLELDRLSIGSQYKFDLKTIELTQLNDQQLTKLSREGQLYLSLVEMQTIQRHFVQQGRQPTDIELETIAQTWSEHCSHKTLAGRIEYTDPNGTRLFGNMLN